MPKYTKEELIEMGRKNMQKTGIDLSNVKVEPGENVVHEMRGFLAKYREDGDDSVEMIRKIRTRNKEED